MSNDEYWRQMPAVYPPLGVVAPLGAAPYGYPVPVPTPYPMPYPYPYPYPHHYYHYSCFGLGCLFHPYHHWWY
ncbi:MAG: hypothetical protein P4N59_28555 [Negativicutes bacterium]|nr:hypothetical protein [Negativicutes bacterium]